MHCAGLCCISFYHSKSRRARNEARNEQVWRNERTNVFVFLHALPSLSDVLPNHDVSSIKFNVPRAWNFYSRPESLWQVLSLHLQIIFTLKPDAAVFATPQLLTGAVKLVCRIFMVDLPILERCGKVPLNWAFTEPHRFEAATDLKVSQGIFSLHLLRPQGQPGFFYLR